MRTLAFIPARDQSRRFPGKNVALFRGEPLVVRAARLALEGQRAGLFDSILVSVEGEEVRRALGEHGLSDLGTWRPEMVQTPEARVLDVLQAHLTAMPEDSRPDAVCVLLPTSPLRTLRHLVKSFRLLARPADVVLSYAAYRQDPTHALGVLSDGRLFLPAVTLPPGVVVHDGTVLWCRMAWALAATSFYDADRVVGYPVPPSESADINTTFDLAYAEWLAERKAR